MKKLALLALGLGAATLAPQAASAQVIINNGGGFHHGGFGGGNFFGGFAFGGFFHQPQFHVQNWQLYGFIQPRHGQRWIRYYDDAYLVDRRGYIHDRRHRVNWDRYGERWARDERGIPYYVGDGDYHPDGRDYQRVDHERRYSSGWDYSGYGSACGRAQRCDDYRGGGHGGYVNGHHGGGYDRGGYRVEVRRGGYDRGGYERRESYGHGYSNGYGGGYAPPPPPYGGACGAGYVCGGSAGYGHSGYSSGYSTGYGHGGGTVVITETTVTPGTASTYVTEEIVEEVIEEGTVRRRHAPRRRAAPPARRYHAPAPKPRVIHPRGDRG